MNGKTIINIEKPTTQSLKAVCGLLSWKGRSSNPLPEFVEMGSGDSRLVLVLSNKRDCFYVTTSRECSCPAHNWHPGQSCKHQRAHFPQEQAAARPAAIESRQPFKPFLEDDARVARVAALPSPLVDCQPEPGPREIAYHSIMSDRDLWPVEA